MSKELVVEVIFWLLLICSLVLLGHTQQGHVQVRPTAFPPTWFGAQQ